jgi:CRISPR/Cas system endoribonuclease Cas6 (RAMP superfamily)
MMETEFSFCLFTHEVQPLKNISGYFMVSFIISSKANDIIRASFLPLSKVSSEQSDLISDSIVASLSKH